MMDLSPMSSAGQDEPPNTSSLDRSATSSGEIGGVPSRPSLFQRTVTRSREGSLRTSAPASSPFLSRLPSTPDGEDAVLPRHPDMLEGQLPNGVDYIVYPNPRPAGYAELRLIVRAGALHEADDQRGTAHLVEHCVFRGVKGFSGHAILKYLASIGADTTKGDLNAFTSRDETVYKLSIPVAKTGAFWQRADHLRTGLEILAGFANDALMEDNDIELERAIVHEEWRQGAADPNLLDIFDPDSPYTLYPTIGTESCIMSTPPDRVRAFYKHWYVTPLMTVIVAGDVDGQAILRAINELFGAIPRREPPHHRGDSIAIHTTTAVNQSGRCDFRRKTRLLEDSLPQNSDTPDRLFTINFKLDSNPRGRPTTRKFWQRALTEMLVGLLVGRRLGELPFLVNIETSHENETIDGCIDWIVLLCIPPPDQPGEFIPCYRKVLMEIETFKRYGPIKAEAQLFQQLLQTLIETTLHTESADLVRSLVRASLGKAAFPGREEDEIQILHEVLNWWEGLVGAEEGRSPVGGVLREDRCVVCTVGITEEEQRMVEAIHREVTTLQAIPRPLDTPEFTGKTPFEIRGLGRMLDYLKIRLSMIQRDIQMDNSNGLLVQYPNGISVKFLRMDEDLMQWSLKFGKGLQRLANKAQCEVTAAMMSLLPCIASGWGVLPDGYVDEITAHGITLGSADGTRVGLLDCGTTGQCTAQTVELFFQVLFLIFSEKAKIQDRLWEMAYQAEVGAGSLSEAQNAFDRMVHEVNMQGAARYPLIAGNTPDLSSGKPSREHAESFLRQEMLDTTDIQLTLTSSEEMVESVLRISALYLATIVRRKPDETVPPIPPLPFPTSITTSELYQGHNQHASVRITIPFEETAEWSESDLVCLVSALSILLERRLHSVIRESRGLVYTIGCAIDSRFYPSAPVYLGVAFMCDPHLVVDITRACMVEIRQLYRSGPSRRELNATQHVSETSVARDMQGEHRIQATHSSSMAAAAVPPHLLDRFIRTRLGGAARVYTVVTLLPDREPREAVPWPDDMGLVDRRWDTLYKLLPRRQYWTPVGTVLTALVIAAGVAGLLKCKWRKQK